MIRHASCLLIVVALAALTSAQGSKPGLTASQQQQLFQKNRTMIQMLVDSSLEISDKSGSYIDRSRSYRKVIMEFQKELVTSANGSDAGRVAEIGKHLDTVMRQGLAPSLQAAHRQIGPKGTGREDLVEIRDYTLELVEWLQEQAKNKWADTPEIREVIQALDLTKKELTTSVGP